MGASEITSKVPKPETAQSVEILKVHNEDELRLAQMGKCARMTSSSAVPNENKAINKS
jgi:hypothetical protein